MKKLTPLLLLILTILLAVFSPQNSILANEQITKPSHDSGRANRQILMQKYFLEELTISITAPTTWMNETRDNHGCQWKWRAQYFCGGVAHEPSDDQHHGWEEVFQRPWNQWVNPDSIPGMWGRIHIQETLDSGYLQWITTYNISQSYPAHYKPGPAEAVKINIKEKATMLAYFQQFKLLMQVVAEFPDYPFVIHVEPDEWGHMLISVPGDDLDPEAVIVHVGGTGMDEIKDLPDNVVGYAQAIKLLRDLYAPDNALLCVSPSPWDWQNRLSAQKWYDMFAKCGILEWDLAVCETGSADLGWSGVDPPYDSTTGMAGGIDNVITWVGQLHNLSDLPFVFWQVPLGNTYFRTCNNTPGHYTHNSAQLLLENYPANKRLQRFADAGGIAVVFSAGQGTSTRTWDDRGDGITNPAPIAGNEGNTSAYPDDDGGYIRLRVSEYYKNPIILNTPIKNPENYSGKYSWKNRFRFSVADIEEIRIYTADGSVIAKFSPDNLNIKFVYGMWDGRDSSGKIASNGVYYYCIKTKKQKHFQKIILLK